jgi:hypothetical protein
MLENRLNDAVCWHCGSQVPANRFSNFRATDRYISRDARCGYCDTPIGPSADVARRPVEGGQP